MRGIWHYFWPENQLYTDNHYPNPDTKKRRKKKQKKSQNHCWTLVRNWNGELEEKNIQKMQQIVSENKFQKTKQVEFCLSFLKWWIFCCNCESTEQVNNDERDRKKLASNEKQQHHKCSKETIMYLSSYWDIYIYIYNLQDLIAQCYCYFVTNLVQIWLQI